MQSVPIITNVVKSISAHGEVYSIQQYVIKFVSDLRQVNGFLLVSFTNKIDCHDITEILLKVALNILILTHTWTYIHAVFTICPFITVIIFTFII